MKRLTKFNFGGIPYVNSDFTDILQMQHIKCYAGILDAMNVDTYTGRNSGIILKGCDVVSASTTTYSINFADSMIYLDGEFYQYNSTSTSSVVINSPEFYLHTMATSSQTRYLRNLTSTASVIESTYFTYSLTEPSGTKPYIKFSSKGTSRRFKRILKFLTSNYGDVYVSSTTQSFSATGLGFNDMEGFIMLNGVDASVPDFSGKFLRGFISNDLASTQISDYFYHNYTGISKSEYVNVGFEELVKKYPTIAQSRYWKRIGEYQTELNYLFAVFNSGGVNDVQINLETTPSHKHEMVATTWSMEHSHTFHTTMNHSPLVKASNNDYYAWSFAGSNDVSGSYTPGLSDTSNTLTGKFFITSPPGGELFYSNFMRAIPNNNNIPQIPTYFQNPYSNVSSDTEGLKQQLNFRPCYTYTFGVVHPNWIAQPTFALSSTYSRNRYPDYILYDADKIPRRPINTTNNYFDWPINYVAKPDLVAIDPQLGGFNLNDTNDRKWPNLLLHTHSIPVGSEGFGGNPAQPHENRPPYRVMVYYTKKFTEPISSYTFR